MALDIPDSGGYSCQFINEIPEEIQTECPICLLTLRDPHMVDCCGYRFCHSCIQSVQTLMKKTCPLCKGEFSGTIPDKQLSRILSRKRVSCVHNDKGCMWTGELKDLERHLNVARQKPKGNTECCPYQALDCTHCRKPFERLKIVSHESMCPRRPLLCEHCEFFTGTRDDIVEHWRVCECYPLECPLKCGKILPRAEMTTHNKKCPLLVVTCDFANIGCNATLHLKDREAHLGEKARDHVTLLVAERRKNKARIDELLQAVSSKDKLIAGMQKKMAKQKEEEATLRRELERESEKSEGTGTSIQVWDFPPGIDENMIRSLFGQYGWCENIYWDPRTNVAVVEFEEPESVQDVLDRHDDRGITLRGYLLNIQPY